MHIAVMVEGQVWSTAWTCALSLIPKGLMDMICNVENIEKQYTDAYRL